MRHGALEQALIAHIVDRENAGYARKNGIGGVKRFQENGQEGRLPVVAMDNVGARPTRPASSRVISPPPAPISTHT